MKPLYIFDLDGTISDCEHRRYLISGDKPDWRSFYESCCMDKPITQVIEVARSLFNTGNELWLFSARDEMVITRTRDWLDENGISYLFTKMKFRKTDDSTPDEQLKKSWLSAMKWSDRKRLIAVFDDRKKVVDMWRANGVFCFHVADGNY